MCKAKLENYKIEYLIYEIFKQSVEGRASFFCLFVWMLIVKYERKEIN